MSNVTPLTAEYLSKILAEMLRSGTGILILPIAAPECHAMSAHDGARRLVAAMFLEGVNAHAGASVGYSDVRRVGT